MDALKALAQAGKAAVTVASQMVGLLTGGGASPAAGALGPAGPGGGRAAMMPRVRTPSTFIPATAATRTRR